MTQAQMSSSPPFVDFGYEPGTLVLGGMWLNTKILDLCVHGSPQAGRQNVVLAGWGLKIFINNQA
ncbi:hypothetical protein IQ244_28460 [Nostoc sp. LEGE 06077]|uniref:hypothetical protein n=1 Tax=Nostoc sp. LEGE 06077 TaxID=915325 RepID=UPI0018803266|nr:hypothetical protein [Nostoc sp. LEGE 06077]MBE9210365.1 hypothetical protein [Nostoc sp. LEGE 06077]